MSETPLESIGEPGGTVGSAEGSRLFVDLGSGVGAIPVRAQEGRGSVIRSSHAAVSAFMVVLAAGGIFGMRKLGMSTRSAAAEVVISIDPATTPKVEAGRFERLMSELEAGDRPVQVDSSRLGRSPFELTAESASVKVDEPRETDAERAARLAEEARIRAQAERGRMIQTTLAGLRLYGVVGGRTPAARLNTQIVREGDVIADLFTVKRILARSVVIEADGVEYEIGMGGGAGQP